MAVRFESKETVTGRVRGSNESIQYEAILRVKDSGKKPVSLELTFVPPQPFVMNRPGLLEGRPLLRPIWSRL